MKNAKLIEKIDFSMADIVQARWDKIVEETNLDSLKIPIEYASLMRIMFQLAYQEGYSDMYVYLKELHGTDRDFFNTLLDKEDNEWRN